MSNILVKTFLKILLDIYLINKKSSEDNITLIDVLYSRAKILIVKGEIKMVDMYYRLVKAGLRTIQKVPDQFRDDVMTNLATLTLSKNGKTDTNEKYK